MDKDIYKDKTKETLKEILKILRTGSVDVKEVSEQKMQDSVEKVLESALLELGIKE